MKFQLPQWRYKNLNTQYEETQKLKRLYVGTLNTDINNEELSEFFGLNEKVYLSKTCQTHMYINKKTNMSKVYAFTVASLHVSYKLIKPKSINFLGINILIEKANSQKISMKTNTTILKFQTDNNINKHLELFIGATSSDLAHFVIPTIQEGCYEQVIVHVSINVC